jgi:fructose-1,6-bisphosphatase I
MRSRGGISTAARRSFATTSKAGSRSTEEGHGTDVTLAEHAAKADRDLARLLTAFAGLATRIRRELPIRRDPAATRNVYGEQQLELDVWMNDLFVEALGKSKLVSQVASEEMGAVKEVGRGRFSVVLDPLDGSSNVKSNNIFGTIFGIFDGKRLPAPGSDLFAAGYLIYGPATTFVYATEGSVQEFVQGGGGGPDEFFLIQEGLRLPSKGKLYGVGGHREKWIPEVKDFISEIERELLNLRYGGSFVGDFNQILHYGGFFAYPAQVDKLHGKYRLHFESNPIAFITEAAGGAGTTGKERILDVAATGIDQTVPTYVGNQDLIDRFRSRF